ncbi:MAG: flagellar biosynthetic protein FliR [Sphingomonadales bacterium 32-64-17]|nr:MAG: flagellar biosynthetic protein FliR [Sphingomonadales bacterium 32-64-17]
MSGLSFGIGPLEAEFWRVVFLMTRIGAAMLAAPIFGAMAVPAQVRVVAAGAIAVFVAAWTDVSPPAEIFSLAGALAVAGEVVLGLTLGFILQIAFAGPVLAAEVIGGAMGLSMAMTTDPQAGTQITAFGQFFTIVLTLIFLALGGHLQWLELVIQSYSSFPPGETWLGEDRAMVIASFGTQLFQFGLLISLPITLVLLMVQLLTGILSRSAPSLNLFALGLPSGVLAGLGALIVASPLIYAEFETIARTGLDNVALVITP